VPGFADFKLRGVHAHGESADAGCEVVARERPLVTLREPALFVEGERMGGDDLTGKEMVSWIHA
jgi:hypothetical protein